MLRYFFAVDVNDNDILPNTTQTVADTNVNVNINTSIKNGENDDMTTATMMLVGVMKD